MNNMDILKEHDFRFNKAYGQNFIFDTNFLSSIVEKINPTGKDVLEIGAGAGTLTAMISKSARKVVSFEIDNNLRPILEQNLATFNNIELIFGDIMQFSIEEIESHFDGNYIMIANLPYYITTPIIFKFLENATRLKSMSIMVQLEVAERLVAKPNTKDYGAITPAIDYRANAEIIKRVNRNMFTPMPNVDSAIVKIDFVQNKYDIVNTQILDETIKSAFAMRRKTIYNNLKSSFQMPAEIIEKILKESNIEKSARGETLSTQQLVTLSNTISKYKK